MWTDINGIDMRRQRGPCVWYEARYFERETVISNIETSNSLQGLTGKKPRRKTSKAENMISARPVG